MSEPTSIGPRSAGPRTGRVRAWLQLMRLPAVFTALADIAAGAAIASGVGGVPGGGVTGDRVALLLAASAGLYLSGMVLNDYFDRRRDAAGRPTRPIPSGRIPAEAAALVGATLMLGGVLLALPVPQAWRIAVGLAGCILLYDGLLKATLAGPLAMGACRTLNLLLGATAAGTGAAWPPDALVPAVALGVYVAGITLFARTEETASQRGPLMFGAVVANVGLLLLAASYLPQSAGVFDAMGLAQPWHRGVQGNMLALAVLAIGFTIDRRLVAALSDPSPARVQEAVKLMLLSIITIDATIVLAATADVRLAVATLALLIPALTVGRWVYVT